MDGGNREEEVLRQGHGLAVASSSPQSPYSTPCHDNIPTQISPSRQYAQHENHHYYDVFADSYPSDETHRPDLYDSPTDDSIASYAANNLQAVASNATVPARGGVSGSPDNFYHLYRGVETVNKHLLSSATHDPMASAVSNNRQPPVSRSTSNGASSKLPAAPGTRTGIRPMHRSASNPVDDTRFPSNDGTRVRSVTGTLAGAPAGNGLQNASRSSVKDMKKKFEQQKGTQSSAEPRRVASRTGTKDGTANGVNGRPAAVSSQSYSSLRTTGTSSAKPSPSRGTQRAKFTAEDQVSTNSQSFASRINRPKGTLASSTQNTRSMTHISPTTSLKQQPSPPEPAPGGSLLFGEIRQEDLNAETPGYGIQGRTRRLSESATQNPMWQHQRSQSDALVEPASPTDWYRGADPTHKNGVGNTGSAAKSHGRSHSELAAAKLPTINTNAQFRKHLDQSPSPHASSPSRLPISVRKLSTASNPASPASTRSNSPAGSRRVALGGRTSRQQSTPTTRAKTPVTRSKTPTTSAASARRTATHPVPSPNNARLASVISPPPRNSPPLRSSRPRQPVSEASTAASRLRTAGRSKSPQKNAVRSSARPESRQDTPSSRRRKLSLGGPVDFAQRRETIKLKYTKSIRETEAARNAAAERRKKELEAAAKAKARAKARVEAQAAAAEAAAAAAATQTRERRKAPNVTQQGEPHTENEAEPSSDRPLVKTPLNSVRAHAPALVLDSPTLGLPGTFPSYGSPPVDGEEAPPSATSETSAVTEFDNEAQTEPPVSEESAQAVVSKIPEGVSNTDFENQLAPQLTSTPAYERATYRDPFEDIVEGDSVSIKISLEPSSPRSQSRDPLARHESEIESAIPGAFADSYEVRSECASEQYFEQQLDTEPELQAMSDRSVEPQRPREAQEDEYEPQPTLVQPYHTTTVTIISRDAGFGPSTYGEKRAEDMLQHHEPQMESPEDYYSVPHPNENVASLRDSTFTASDAGTSDGPSGSADVHHTPDTSRSLNVPSMMTPANRSSQQSIWTDISYSSRDSLRRLDYLDGQRHSGADESRPQSIRDDESTYRRRYLASESGLVRDDEAQSETHQYHMSPELDAGVGLDGSYLAGRSPHIPRLPDHSPPPPPETASRPNSMYYDGHRPSSTLTRDDQVSIGFPISRTESEDYQHHSSSPQSLDGRSVATDNATLAQTLVEGDNKPPGDADDKSAPIVKGKNRLRQRQMVIKELVDTEAVFVRDMNVVEEIYKGTAEACPRLDDKTIKLIFRNTHEIVAFHTTFLSELKDGVTSVYVPKGRRSPVMKEDTAMSDATTIRSFTSTAASTVPSTAASSTTAVSLSGTTATNGEQEDAQDRQTIIGPAFIRNIEQMRAAHEGFLRTSDVANKRLIEIQQDPTVQVWLNECNEVAKDLTAAWNLDSLLIKPMQRITKYPNLISQLLEYTPEDHPDREGLINARATVETAILEINKTKKNFELVGQIVGRKRKESDVKAGFARAFGKRVDKLQASGNRPPEDPEYLKLKEKFNDDYLRLQVVLRDVEFYTRQVSTYVQAFLDYLSAIELVTRLQPGPYPELESKWVQFNVSMRDIKKVALDQHLSKIRKHVIEPFELVIQSYQNPLLALKKRNKRRLDYEKSIQLKKGGKKIDKQLTELVEHYEALNDTLKKELPQLSALTEKVGNICLGNMINIQAKWWFIWKEKVRGVAAITEVPEISDIVSTFHRDFRDMEEQISSLTLLNLTSMARSSQSTTDDSMMARTKSRPSDVGTPRSRGLSVTSDVAPMLPTPDFQRTGQLTMSPPASNNAVAGPSGYFYRDYYSGLNSRGPTSPTSSDFSNAPRSIPGMSVRPGTGRSFDSTGMPPRPSIDSAPGPQARRDSSSTNNATPSLSDSGNRGSGLFHSALPLTETAEEPQRSSRASSRERFTPKGYNVLWLAASLFEFNIETTKHEAGYPYLTYQAGEIFDVIAEKGELWLAKNQDDPSDLVGWIWSKHFAKLADS
ncbi:Dynamin-binding protein [Cytospora mali]|uniref:Dynamin-binding protein n=1 Tax=Cytospora mali TaxID=578113 RepID=A0A194VRD8_CYTMA|nr:Dynamin-binding protein [Valsa mali]